MIDPTVYVTGAAAGLLRNVAGWLENAMKDGKITPYEWGELGATIFRTLILTTGLHFGLGLDPLAAGGSAVIADFIIKAIKK